MVAPYVCARAVAWQVTAGTAETVSISRAQTDANQQMAIETPQTHQVAGGRGKNGDGNSKATPKGESKN